MTTNYIKKVLDAHGMEYREEAGHIIGIERFSRRVYPAFYAIISANNAEYHYGKPEIIEEIEEIDYTEWTKEQFLTWLGY